MAAVLYRLVFKPSPRFEKLIASARGLARFLWKLTTLIFTVAHSYYIGTTIASLISPVKKQSFKTLKEVLQLLLRVAKVWFKILFNGKIYSRFC